MLDVFEWHRLYKCAFCICGFVSFSLVLWVSCDDGRLPFCHHHESTRCSPVPLKRDAGWAAVDLSALGSCKCLSPKQDLLPVRTSLPWSPSPWVVTAFHPLSSSSSPKQGLQWRFTGDRNKAGEDAAEPLAATGTWRVAGNQEPGARAKATSVDCYEFSLRPTQYTNLTSVRLNYSSRVLFLCHTVLWSHNVHHWEVSKYVISNNSIWWVEKLQMQFCSLMTCSFMLFTYGGVPKG